MISQDWNFDLEPYIGSVELPKVCRIRQKFSKESITDIPSHLIPQLENQLAGKDLVGKRIAITAGSRGITGLVEILKTVAEELQKRGAIPFITAAMGSHGGASDEGQRSYLEGLGITKEALGIEICSSMLSVQIGALENGFPVYCDKLAAEADGIIVINKIRPHANFKGELESGLCKMMAIGLGKRDGAAGLHRLGYGVFPEYLSAISEVFINKLNIMFGVAIVENAYDRPMICEVIPTPKIEAREKELLKLAKAAMAQIPGHHVDVLVVDKIGKNISGQGMDPNVTGRSGSPLHKSFNEDFIDRIVVLDLTPETHGIFAGLGMADFSTARMLKLLDFKATYINEVTSRTTPPARIPLLAKDDMQALQLATYMCDAYTTGNIGLVHIADTSHLFEMEVSRAFLDTLDPNSYEFADGPEPVWHPLEFTGGRLNPI